MIRDREIWTPENSIILWRVIGLCLLCILWLRSQGGEVGVVLLLFLSIMALARWRFVLPEWMVIIDQLACFLIIPHWPAAYYFLAIPMFEAMLIGKHWIMIPTVVALLYLPPPIILIAVFIQAGFTGWVLRCWWKEMKLYRQEADLQRRSRYELEALKSELLVSNIQGARMAELTERNRIAQQLHDEVGHEITAAVLALQAFEQLWREDDPLANEMFIQAQKRLSNSALYLRETVHNMKPVKAIGIDSLLEISNGFSICPVNFQAYGDTSRVPVYLWSILEPCLKEALTNVMRHAKASKVDVDLDVNPNIIRLSIQNDGSVSNSDVIGIGMRNLRQRARAVGGSLSIDTSDGFRLICVLPLDKDYY
ncbi:sensor histidine kinase [Alkaliphilus peptidifermentans]|uniref:histidine kinase n=1 Tax=Alkaliphilus peptidifermentans DSM 18978 TaxID=1120976 RepID=A0A1G5JSH7_9FIRM|nr:histidine kinase [Alkaliphilus peptidifermentans]SCY91392.1 Signal transduction histidine kinase [Alkaliphilus peptidifermentans DSM 18978]